MPVKIPNVGGSDEYFTPPEIFSALRVHFDLDVASPANGRAFLSVPCSKFYTPDDDGLSSPWRGIVWMNPPFGGRNGCVPWLRRFVEHGNGIGLLAAYTSCGWFQDWMPQMDAVVFPRGKTRFILPDGSRAGCPQTGVVIFGIGRTAYVGLQNSNLGIFYPNTHRPGRTLCR